MLARVTILLTFLAVALAAPLTPDPEMVASQRIAVLQKQYQQNTLHLIAAATTGCTAENIRRRKEWNALTNPEKKSFIASIHCLNALPSEIQRTNATHAPGARTRYDDFIVTHIDQTPFVHGSGLFLPFHRHLVHLFETDLRARCGYAGPLPYWDWTRSWRDPRRAQLFDGSDTSLGGNGRFVPGRNATPIGLPGGLVKLIPPATGGGCVTEGPFAEGKYEVRLGPVGYEPKGPDGGLGYNPRCLTRDLSPEFSKGTRPSAVTALVDGCKDDLGCVNEEMDMAGGVPGGIHASGHWQVGLHALDVYASPSDPVFWLHHTQVDRVWTIWQGQNIEGRTRQVWGTSTAANIPPTPNVTLDTMMDFGVLGPAKSIRQLVSPVEGEYCYMYE
ncbi:88c663b0-d9d2-428b-889e-92a8e620b601 [Thermothielavioides terrestris]|uniref:88c663b0-d9d2-428b-889e-92a8e620b601 n=1 Tax=Thermothielavioides terrestris TaxID=2587410 RepID=A0A3S4AUM2_9PEZI|nr:88c663b0-d9d2-428b-889e-92a8e620b601 [Thermothielavioides terrestris]